MSTLDELETPNEKRAAMARALATGGFDDVLVLRQSTAGEVLTEKRRELLEYLRDHEPESVRAAARALDRDKGVVSRDLALLAEHDVVTYRRDGVGKAPRLKRETVVVEPVV